MLSIVLRLVAIVLFDRLLPSLITSTFGHAGAFYTTKLAYSLSTVILLTFLLKQYSPRREFFKPHTLDAFTLLLITASPLIVRCVSPYAFKVESQFYGPHLIYAFTVYPVTAIGTWQTLDQLSRTRRLIAVLLTLIAVQFNLDIPMFISLGKCHKVLLVPSAALVLSAVITTKWRCIYTLLTALSISALFILLAVSQVPCCHWSLSQSSPRIVDNKVAILAEGESVTGWISVSRHDKYKAMLMRSDMSILGGVYLETGDSVYGIFNVMETIRLLADGAKGLQIGLGVGITASALTRQGVLVDVIELDPLVYRYASDWFNLRLNRAHSQVYLEDALLVLPRLAPSQYDFIIHDVFTGGLLESSLFSQEFLISIKRVMLPSAVLGMNIVGTLNGTVFQSIYQTAKSQFANIRCFADEFTESSLRNYVLFASDAPLRFRPFRESDYLDSDGRYETFSKMFQFEVSAAEIERNQLKRRMIITKSSSDSRWFAEEQMIGAQEHWLIMHRMFPADFWLSSVRRTNY